MSDAITIDKYRPEYGQGVARCFRAVYGEGYPVKIVYDPDMLQAEFIKGSFYTVVALNERGEVIGVMGLYRSSSPYPSLYEIGAGIVLPQYRAHNIAGKLCGYIYENLATEVGIEELFGEAVSNHTTMQKIALQYGNIEAGLEIDLMPAEAYTREKSSSGRVATIIQFRCYKDKEQAVYIPETYVEESAFLYVDLKRKRTFLPSAAQIPSQTVTSGNHVFFEFARVGRLMLSDIGTDFASYIEAYEKSLTDKAAHVSQVFLRLDCPWVGKAVEELRSRGYFLSGILPRWFDADGVLMQRIYGKPNWEGINLYSDRARQILSFIRDDWERTRY